MSICANKNSKKTSNKKAYTLIEILLVLTILTALVTSAINIFSITNEQGKINRTINDVSQIRSIVESLFPPQIGYGDVDPQSLKSSLSQYIYKDGVIINAFVGVIALRADTIYIPNDSYDIIITNLNKTSCSRLAMTKFGDALNAVNIDPSNGTPQVSTSSTAMKSFPIAPNVAYNSCSGTLNSVGFQFR